MSDELPGRPTRNIRTSERPFRNLLSGLQLIEQSLGLLQITRVEPFSEPAVDRSEKIACLIAFALIAPQPRPCRSAP